MIVLYSFIAKGKTPDGNRYRCSGHLKFEEGYPFEAFEAAADCVEKQMGVRPDTSRGGVTLKRLKKAI